MKKFHTSIMIAPLFFSFLIWQDELQLDSLWCASWWELSSEMTLLNSFAIFYVMFLRVLSPSILLTIYIIAFNMTFVKSLMIIYYNIVLRIVVYLNADFSIHGTIHYAVWDMYVYTLYLIHLLHCSNNNFFAIFTWCFSVCWFLLALVFSIFIYHRIGMFNYAIMQILLKSQNKHTHCIHCTIGLPSPQLSLASENHCTDVCMYVCV